MRERRRYIRGMVPWLGFASFGFEYHREERFMRRNKIPVTQNYQIRAGGRSVLFNRAIDDGGQVGGRL